MFWLNTNFLSKKYFIEYPKLRPIIAPMYFATSPPKILSKLVQKKYKEQNG
jgi:hypothetical protein